MELLNVNWEKDPHNPILPTGLANQFDTERCMNPFVIKTDTEYRLYYSGKYRNNQRICLATAPLDNPTDFTRHGVILDVSSNPENFDYCWCVLPCVHKFGDKWHMYYTGNDGSEDGLQAFGGIGLALSDDGINFERYSEKPVITGNQLREFPENRGIAGGGSIIEHTLSDGSVEYRMYYTIAVGKPSISKIIDQEKHCAVCHSKDGINWYDHRLIMVARRDVNNEDVAVAAPFVWRDGDCYRMLYSGIGTRWDAYSLSEAVSRDGYLWHRGSGNNNLSLQPAEDDSWEGKMVEYANIIHEDKNLLRLFYCGNGYGVTGIGTAICHLPEEQY